MLLSLGLGFWPWVSVVGHGSGLGPDGVPYSAYRACVPLTCFLVVLTLKILLSAGPDFCLPDSVVHAFMVRYMAVLHGALHGRLCMLMLQMIMPRKGCIDSTML